MIPLGRCALCGDATATRAQWAGGRIVWLCWDGQACADRMVTRD
jgi:hypothetical protein